MFAEAATPQHSGPWLPRPGPGANWGVAGSLSAAELALFAELLSGLVKSNIPLPDALLMLGRDAESRRLRKALAEVQVRVAAGATLAAALRSKKNDFPELFVSLVEQGLASNQLHATLVELVREYRSQIRFREALWSQLLSPLATAVAMGAVVVVLSIINLPILWEELFRYERTYDNLMISLPWPTVALLELHRLLRDPSTQYLFAGLIVLGIFCIRRLSRSRRIRFWTQCACLRLPVIGEYLRTRAITRFCRLLSLLLLRGLPLESALGFVRDATSLLPMQEELSMATSRVNHGSGLTEAMRGLPLVPPTLVQVLAGAQAHGELPAALSHLADLYEERGDLQGAKVRLLVFVSAELILSAAVFFFAIGYFLPFSKIGEALRRK